MTYEVITVEDGVAEVNEDKCDGCGICGQVYPSKAISMTKPSKQKFFILFDIGLIKDLCRKGKAFKGEHRYSLGSRQRNGIGHEVGLERLCVRIGSN